MPVLKLINSLFSNILRILHKTFERLLKKRPKAKREDRVGARGGREIRSLVESRRCRICLNLVLEDRQRNVARKNFALQHSVVSSRSMSLLYVS